MTLALRPYVESDRSDFIAMMRAHSSMREEHASSEFDAYLEPLIARYFAAVDGEMFVGTGSILPLRFGVVEIGYIVRADLRNRGYGTQIAQGLVEKAHAIFGSTRVVAHVLVKNTASQRVLVKAGFTRSLDGFVASHISFQHTDEGPTQHPG